MLDSLLPRQSPMRRVAFSVSRDRFGTGGRSAGRQWKGGSSMTEARDRRDFIKLGGIGGVAVAAAGAATALGAQQAAAQAASESLLRTVLNRGKLIVGTGSTNPPWHFEDDKRQLTALDIATARLLSKGLFDDVNKVEFVKQD